MQTIQSKLQIFYGNEVNSNKPFKNEKKSLELRDWFYLFLSTYVNVYFISINAFIRNDYDDKLGLGYRFT